jgi:DNA-binding PadR family transcriptional regulator
MSRGRGDDDRTGRPNDGAADLRPGWQSDRKSQGHPERDLVRLPGRPELPVDRLLLPKDRDRELVNANNRTYHLRGSETRLLSTVGAFRVVREDDLIGSRFEAPSVYAELRRLADAGLVERRTIAINHEPTRIVVLTRSGQSLLNDHRDPSPDTRDQAYHAGLVKRRELAHDAQLYRLFQTEAAAIEARGGRIERVVIDAELKRDYQSFLNRPDHAAPDQQAQDVEVFARAHDLPVVDGHLQLPDLRIEYEIEGHLERRDLELVTEHYSRAHVATKARAGFALYRAHGRGGAKRGGSPQDPHHLRQLA